MPLLLNLQLLRQKPQQLSGELPVAEFTDDFHDDLLTFTKPLQYDLAIREEGEELFIQGRLSTTLIGTCCRCLKTFALPLAIPEFAALAPLEGEEAIPVEGDFANLTPLLREDILLALPTAPLCKPDCRGLAAKAPSRDSRTRGSSSLGTDTGKSPWDALEQLKLK